jgi:hypothetical protein
MIELSFENVNNALSKDIHVQAYCVTMAQADYVFRRACDIYLPKNETVGYYAKKTDLLLEIQYTALRFRSWKQTNESWRGFRGVLMIHPDLSTRFTKQRDFDLYDEMSFHNQRYLDSWQS